MTTWQDWNAHAEEASKLSAQATHYANADAMMTMEHRQEFVASLAAQSIAHSLAAIAGVLVAIADRDVVVQINDAGRH